MSELIFSNTIKTDGIVFDIHYECPDKELFIKATLLLPIACSRQYPLQREHEILQYLDHFDNKRIWTAVWFKLRPDSPVPENVIDIRIESLNNIYCPRVSTVMADNVVILACEISESPDRDATPMTQLLAQQNPRMYFSKDPGVGGTVTELRFEQPISDEEKIVLRAIVLTPMAIPQVGTDILKLGNQAIKKALWAGFRANWNEYNAAFRQIPAMSRQSNPQFELLEAYTYPFVIAAPPANELIILEWHADIVSLYFNQDD